MRPEDVAESVAAQAAHAIIEAHLPYLDAAQKARLMQEVRVPVLTAIWGFFALVQPKRRQKVLRRKYVSLTPSLN